MKKLSKEEVKRIIDNRPMGITPEGIITALREKGYELEGYGGLQVLEPKKTVVEKVGGFLGMEKLGKGIAGTIFFKTQEGKNVLKMLKEGKMSYEEFERQFGDIMPSSKEVVGSTIQTAATVATLGGAAKASTIKMGMAKMGGLGATSGFGRGIEQEKTIGEATKQAAISGIATAGTYGTLAGVGNFISKLPARLMNSAIKAPNLELGQQLVDRGFFGSSKSMLAKSVKKIIENEAKLDKTLLQTTGKNKLVKSLDILKALDPLKKQYKHSPSVLKIIDKEVNKWVTQKSYSTLDANVQKRILYELLNDRSYQMGIKHSAQKKVIKQLARGFKESIEKVVPQVKSINTDLGIYVQARNALAKRVKTMETSQILKVTDMMSAMGGGLFSTISSSIGVIPGALAATGLRRSLESATTKTGMGKIMSLIQKIPTDTAGKINKTVLINLLKGR